jgi:glutamate-ammonia-ligase adenylyltransferase
MTETRTLHDRLLESEGGPKRFDESVATRLQVHLSESGVDVGPPVVDILANIASASPYLFRLFLQEAEKLAGFLHMVPEEAFRSVIDVTKVVTSLNDIEQAKKELRRQKSHMAMLLAVLDLGGVWTDEKVMHGLTEFADEAVRSAFEIALRSLTDFPETELLSHSGLAVLAMGKHGAGELNYSSDIDLVVFYAPEAVAELVEAQAVAPRLQEPRAFMVRVVQTAVALLHEQTPDGYVFRTDLRLRPDPGASAVAVTLSAAERYYETYGQNWERAAYIKSRFVAGQQRVADELQQILTPFIWRKYLDFAAIQDIHSIKRQIHAVKGNADIQFAGHDIKVGRGGIREIEFFAQTQQLILGGKDETLRNRKTLDTLQDLVHAEQISQQAADELSEAYLYLRHIEHRIQMVNDEQAHSIPKSEDGITRLARLCGYQEMGELEDRIVACLKTVHYHYADLFYESDPLSDVDGSLVFTGVEDDTETIGTLQKMGFEDPSYISGMIRKWHAGDMRATRTTRAREILTRLVPAILRALAKAATPDEAFRTFDSFLRRMPAGVQVFSLLENNLSVLDVITRLVDLSPRLAREMATHSLLVEALLDDDLLQSGSNLDAVEFTKNLLAEEILENAMNMMRREARQARFATACRLLLTRHSIRQAARDFTTVADCMVQAALPLARKLLVEAHGDIPGHLAVVAMGRHGAQNLTASSDLDLIFIYDVAANAESDGEKPLDGVTWFTRYVRRLVTILSAQTEEGGLYEVDMALRPSGGAGPAAVSFSAFQNYYDHDAWTWEEMALVKARVIAGEKSLADRAEVHIEKILTRQRETEKVRKDVLDMRGRLLAQKPAKSHWDLKLAKGGLTDIDFICQYMSLVHGAEHGRFPHDIREALSAFVAVGLLDAPNGEVLGKAASDYERLMQLTRAALGESLTSLEPDRPLTKRLAEAMNVSSLAEAEELVLVHQQKVQAAFIDIIGRYEEATPV